MNKYMWLALLVGCASPSSAPSSVGEALHTEVPSLHVTYARDSCADSTGRTGSAVLQCEAPDVVTWGWCSTVGATIAYESIQGGAYVCQADWKDPIAGGRICAHVNCESR